MKSYATPGSKLSLAPALRTRADASVGSLSSDVECEECKRKNAPLDRRAGDAARHPCLAAITHDVPRFGHDFSRMRVHSPNAHAPLNQSADGVDDEEVTTQTPGAESAARKEPPTTAPSQAGGSVDARPMDSAASSCPSSTQVEKLTDLTPDGLKAGYTTAYGALVTMRVMPDSVNWNGTRIIESLTLDPSGTCPKGLTSQPCTAGPPFTVGDGTKGSSVLPAQPGQKNRFYDFHRTRSNSSLLHDPTRNPTGMNSCTMICKQSYACGGTVIGSFTITRTFTKGKYQGKDVTLVSIAKT